jgi:hypothetical protein
LVFSDFDLEASKADDIRFSLEEIPWMERGWRGSGGFSPSRIFCNPRVSAQSACSAFHHRTRMTRI